LPLDEGALYRAASPVLVSVTDLEIEVSAPDGELRDLFGLTGAEVRLAAAVFEGLTLAEAAERFGLSVNTVRFQLARIFDKTGVSRQAELVKLMMRLASAPGPR
jgi:DNA-binding CsgD family transcriptional regulator